jgi:hypothetical protein
MLIDSSPCVVERAGSTEIAVAAAGSQPKTASDRIFPHRFFPTNPRESHAETSNRLIRTSVT